MPAVTAGGCDDSTDDKTIKGSSVDVETRTQTHITSKSVYMGRSVRLEANVTSGNSRVNGGNVTFKVNNKSVGTSNVNGGSCSYTLNTTGYASSNYTYYAVFSGCEGYGASTSNQAKLSVNKHQSMIKVENVRATYTDKVALRATIVDKTMNDYIKSGKVVFKVNGVSVGYAKIKNGKAVLSYDTSQLKGGTYNISVAYGGSTLVNPYRGSASLTIDRMTTKLSMTNVNAYSNTSTSLTVRVRDSNGRSVNGGRVVFKVNGISIGYANVTSGSATLRYTPANVARNYTLTVKYSGSTRYTPSSTTSKLLVSLRVYTVNWNSKGNVKKNTVLYKNLTKTSLTDRLVNIASNATPYVVLGDGKGKCVFIVAGIHGNELSSQSAAIRLINDLSTRTIHGTVYIFPFVAPSYTGNNTRKLGGVNLNDVADKSGSLSNNIYKFAKRCGATSLGDFHCTMPGGKPGRNAIFGSSNPQRESATLSKYISNKTSSSSIVYKKAGVEYPGALEDYCNLHGIVSVTCEVKTQHGTIARGSVEKSYQMMKAYLSYYKLI